MIKNVLIDQIHYKHMKMLLKPKRRTMLRQNQNHTLILVDNNLTHSQKVDINLIKVRQRSKSCKKRTLGQLFENNITFFLRLNSQKSVYQNLFSGGKKRGQRKLYRPTSAKLQPSRRAIYLQRSVITHLNTSKSLRKTYFSNCHKTTQSKRKQNKKRHRFYTQYQYEAIQ